MQFLGAKKLVKPPTFWYCEVHLCEKFCYWCPFLWTNLTIFALFWPNLVAHYKGQVSVQALHYSYQTDVTIVSTGRGKNLYGQPSLGVVGDSHSSRSNDITLALALLQRFYSPRVSGSTLGKPFRGCAPQGVPSGDPSTIRDKCFTTLLHSCNVPL